MSRFLIGGPLLLLFSYIRYNTCEVHEASKTTYLNMFLRVWISYVEQFLCSRIRGLKSPFPIGDQIGLSFKQFLMRSGSEFQSLTFRSEKRIGLLMQSDSATSDGTKSDLRIRWPKSADLTHRPFVLSNRKMALVFNQVKSNWWAEPGVHSTRYIEQ